VVALALGLPGALVAASLPRSLPQTVAQSLPDEPGVAASVAGVPPATASFVSAYGHGNIATMERVASPLYFVEWARQGVSPGDQASLLQGHEVSPSGEWLFFSFATGLVDRSGFGHYLYVGRPISATGSPSPSIWRVDADAAGRVIWIELVWLFQQPPAQIDALPRETAREAGALPAKLASGPTDVLFGVRSADGLEGYYGVEALAGAGSGAGEGNLRFYAADKDGRLRLSGWTYGERIPNRPLADGRDLQPDQASLLADYLASIR
jgi:hypothetical protein